MARVVCVMGESGSGKTTSMRTLDPKKTFYFDCDKKGLSWKGWKNDYNAANKNYVSSDVPKAVLGMLKSINEAESFKHVTAVVIDTINGLMVADEMRRMNEKGYDKWMDLAASVYELVDYALTCRGDLTIVFTAHTQSERDDNGYSWTHIKTSGKKLDKIVLESKFTTVLLAKCVDGKYVFETNSNNSTAKSPLGAFEEKVIPNDMAEVIKALEEF